ncbi:hypothetical protein [Falsiroseomonas sp. CW058]|uniref:hypothetical protein n=1 Tax=Falsiroseomonas sp. CW058 TaxID=3388664 RepID=UPI003D315592
MCQYCTTKPFDSGDLARQIAAMRPSLQALNEISGAIAEGAGPTTSAEMIWHAMAVLTEEAALMSEALGCEPTDVIGAIAGIMMNAMPARHRDATGLEEINEEAA